jgi:hypothetical protein
MLAAETAIFGHVQAIRVVLLVLLGIIVALLALLASQRDLNAHGLHLLFAAYLPT